MEQVESDVTFAQIEMSLNSDANAKAGGKDQTHSLHLHSVIINTTLKLMLTLTQTLRVNKVLVTLQQVQIPIELTDKHWLLTKIPRVNLTVIYYLLQFSCLQSSFHNNCS